MTILLNRFHSHRYIKWIEQIAKWNDKKMSVVHFVIFSAKVNICVAAQKMYWNKQIDGQLEE